MNLMEVNIGGYAPKLAALAHDSSRPAEVWDRECAEVGGFNPHTRRLTKICCTEGTFMCEHLDHVTAAVEAGVVKQHAFVEQLFASYEDFDEFLDHLLAYPGRIHDRWHYALATLAGLAFAQESLATTKALVDALREAGR